MSDYLKFPVSLWCPTESMATALSPRFIFLCKSTEFFLASYADTAGYESEPKIIPGQVGIRCIYCTKLMHIKHEDKLRSMAFPRSIEDTAYCLQFLGLVHIFTCPSAPFVPNFSDQTDKVHLHQLSTYCALTCEKLNIVSRAPHLSGLFLRQPPIMKPHHVCFNSLDDFDSLNIMEKACSENQLARAEHDDSGSGYEPVVHYSQLYPGHDYHPSTLYADPSFRNAPWINTQNKLSMESSFSLSAPVMDAGYGIIQHESATSNNKSRPQKKRPLLDDDDEHSVMKKARLGAQDPTAHYALSAKNPHYNVGNNVGHKMIPKDTMFGPTIERMDRTSFVDNKAASSRQNDERRVDQFSAIELFNLAMDMLERGDDTRSDRSHAPTSQDDGRISLFQNEKQSHALDQSAIQPSSSTMVVHDEVKVDGHNYSLTGASSKDIQKLSNLYNSAVNRAPNGAVNRDPTDTLKSNATNVQTLSIAKSPAEYDFPYFRDVFGSWVCRFCCYVPFSDRAFGSIWQRNEPPDHQFMQSHLRLCNSFIQHQNTLERVNIDDKAHSQYDSVGGPSQRSTQPSESHNIDNQSEPAKTQSIETQLKPRSRCREKQAQVKKDMLTKTRETDAIASAIASLEKYENEVTEVGKDKSLVSADDHQLISDFMFYIIKQLHMCSLDETDQKGRGKTRATFEIGFMGVQCNHCKVKPRKYFWTNVSRFNNSFSSEIISHVMSCCPNEVQKQLLELKKIHSEQMSYLPRGSQKLFFDRLWGRLHNDHKAESLVNHINDTGNLYLGDDSLEEIKRMSEDSLVLNHDALLDKENCFSFGSTTAVKGVFLLLSLKRILDPPILLAVDEDFLFLPQYDCFIRNNLEVFCAEENTSLKPESCESGHFIEKGRIGIRCVHCVSSGDRYDENAVSFPESLGCIHQSAHSIATNHFGRCPCLPKVTRDAFLRMKSNIDEVFPSALAKKYYSSAGMALGLVSAPNDFGLVLSKCGQV